jgi:hypothetical protein
LTKSWDGDCCNRKAQREVVLPAEARSREGGVFVRRL